MKFKTNKGFTLIELLVVIAIIGILSSVVLASLNTARDKGRDAAIQSNMQTIRVTAEVYFDDTIPLGYGDTAIAAGDCTTAGAMFVDDPSILAAVTDIETLTPGAAAAVCNISANQQAWAMSAALNDPVVAGEHWCVDSTGQASETAALVAQTQCP